MLTLKKPTKTHINHQQLFSKFLFKGLSRFIPFSFILLVACQGSSEPTKITSQNTTSSITDKSPTSNIKPITTQGNKILFGGENGSIAGMSLFWSNTGWGGEKFYNAQAVAWIKSDWNAKLIRVAVGADEDGGYISDPTGNKSRAFTVIDAAIANDIYVIIDWHSHKAEQNKAQAIQFFQEMATKYGNKDNVIYEIYNEPLNISWSNVLKPYAIGYVRLIQII